MAKDVITAIDICGGAGGWACAARGLPVRIVYTVDLWDACMKTYELNHPGTECVCGDIRDEELRADILRRFRGVDLVLGAIPCEWLSVCRNIHQTTFEELERERATLEAALGLARDLEPRWWCFEDVIQLAKELPEGTPSRVIDSADYSPQKRKRLYVGEFPEPAPGDCADVMSAYLRPGPYRIGYQTYGREVHTHGWGDGMLQPYLPDRKSRTIVDNGSRNDPRSAIADSRVPGGIRQIEWQEAARLQGFPEDYLFYASPTALAKIIGQAVQIDTAHAILEAIVAEWKAKKGKR